MAFTVFISIALLSIRKEEEERARAILGGLLFFFGLVTLAALASGERS